MVTGVNGNQPDFKIQYNGTQRTSPQPDVDINNINIYQQQQAAKTYKPTLTERTQNKPAPAQPQQPPQHPGQPPQQAGNNNNKLVNLLLKLLLGGGIPQQQQPQQMAQMPPQGFAQAVPVMPVQAQPVAMAQPMAVAQPLVAGNNFEMLMNTPIPGAPGGGVPMGSLMTQPAGVPVMTSGLQTSPVGVQGMTTTSLGGADSMTLSNTTGPGFNQSSVSQSFDAGAFDVTRTRTTTTFA